MNKTVHVTINISYNTLMNMIYSYYMNVLDWFVNYPLVLTNTSNLHVYSVLSVSVGQGLSPLSGDLRIILLLDRAPNP